jgi:type I restriction enzyme S subunit
MHNAWNRVRFGDIAEIIKGVSYASEDYCGPDDGMVFLTIKCVSKAGGFKQAGVKYFKGKPAGPQFLNPGDLLISNTDLTRAGDIVGAPLVVPSFDGKQITLSMDLSKVVESNEKVDRQFLYYMLMTDHARRFMKDHASGSTVLHLQTRAVPQLRLEIPKQINEQSKIAEVLSTVDRAIAQTEALIAKQQRIKTGLMQDLLTRGIDEHGNLRNEATHTFKDSPLGRIPAEWDVVPVKSLLRAIDGGWSPSCIDEPPSQGEWGVLKVSAVSSGIYQPNESKRLPGDLSPIPALEVQQGDVLLCRANGVAELVGTCAYVRQTPTRLLLSDKTLRLQPIPKWVTPYVLSLLLGAHSSRLQIMASFSGSSGQKNISQAQIQCIQVRRPPLAEQERLVSILEKSSDQIRSSRESLEKLRSLKASLMQDLITGKVRVTPLLKQAEEATA